MSVKATIDYTNTTYEDLRDALIRRIPYITDRWTDYNESDIGVTLLELFCGAATYLNYMIDRRANECLLPNMREKKHGILFGQSVGYKFHGMVPAKTMLRFSIPSVIGNNIIIPKYTRLKSKGSSTLTVVTMTEAIIPAGQLYVDVVGWQGYDLRPVVSYDTTIDPPPYILTDPGVAHGSVEVRVNGSLWQEVETFVSQRPDAKVFRTYVDAQQNTYIEFGDDFEGEIPIGTIDLGYVITLGTDGNRGSGTITSMEDSVSDVMGIPIALSVINTSELAGGSGHETLYHAKKQLPAEVQANSRGVTYRDIKAIVEGFPGVKQCQVLDINDYPLYSFEISYYEIQVPIIPDNEGLPGQALKQAVHDHIIYDKGVTFPEGLTIMDPNYIIVDVAVNAIKFRSYTDSAVIENSTLEIQEFMKIASSPEEEFRLTGAVDGLVFGQDLEFEQLVAALVNLQEVSTLDSLVFTVDGVQYGTGQAIADVAVANREIAYLGDITINITGEV